MGVTDGADFFNVEAVPERLDFIKGEGFIVAERVTCDRNKLYLDTCATNHTMFALEMLDWVPTGVKLRQHCNAGTTTTAKVGYWRGIKFWVNECGIANLLSLPQLEKDGYQLEYDMRSGWRVHTPTGNTIHFKMDRGMRRGMLYIDLTTDPSKYVIYNNQASTCVTCNNEGVADELAMLESVRDNFEEVH